jgi:acyl carrier protein
VHMTSTPSLNISSGGLVGTAGFSRREALRGLVAAILATKGISHPFADDDTLAEIGIGSADMIELLLAVESAFNVEVPQHEITPDVFRSVATLDALMQRLLPAAPVTAGN